MLGRETAGVYKEKIVTQPSKGFKPTPAQVRAAELVFVCKAHMDLIRPRVEAIRNKVLAQDEYLPDSAIAEAMPDCPARILDDKFALCMRRDHYDLYVQRSRDAFRDNGIRSAQPNCDPLTEAQDQLSLAMSLLVEALEPDFPNVPLAGWTNLPSQHQERYIELALQLLSPFVRNADDLMESLTSPPGAKHPLPAH